MDKITEIKTIIGNVLSIISFSGDKDNFIEEFLKECNEKSVEFVLQSLPDYASQKLQLELSKSNSQQEIDKLICNYISQEKYFSVIFRVSKELFFGFLLSKIDNMSVNQKTNLSLYLKQITSNYPLLTTSGGL